MASWREIRNLMENPMPVKSYAPEVQTDASGKWYGNALRFATFDEAALNVSDLAIRWYSVRDTRVVESDEPVNYSYVNGNLVAVVS